MNVTRQELEGLNGIAAASRAPTSGKPLALGLRLTAGLEGLAALHAREARAGVGGVKDLGEHDTLRLATGASLLAAAVRPHLRLGALVTATFGHSLRTVALSLEPQALRRKERLAVELTMSAALGWLLLQAARATRWEG